MSDRGMTALEYVHEASRRLDELAAGDTRDTCTVQIAESRALIDALANDLNGPLFGAPLWISDVLDPVSDIEESIARLTTCLALAGTRTHRPNEPEPPPSDVTEPPPGLPPRPSRLGVWLLGLGALGFAGYAFWRSR